jgi:hypothetical protein
MDQPSNGLNATAAYDLACRYNNLFQYNPVAAAACVAAYGMLNNPTSNNANGNDKTNQNQTSDIESAAIDLKKLKKEDEFDDIEDEMENLDRNEGTDQFDQSELEPEDDNIVDDDHFNEEALPEDEDELADTSENKINKKICLNDSLRTAKTEKINSRNVSNSYESESSASTTSSERNNESSISSAASNMASPVPNASIAVDKEDLLVQKRQEGDDIEEEIEEQELDEKTTTKKDQIEETNKSTLRHRTESEVSSIDSKQSLNSTANRSTKLQIKLNMNTESAIKQYFNEKVTNDDDDHDEDDIVDDLNEIEHIDDCNRSNLNRNIHGIKNINNLAKLKDELLLAVNKAIEKTFENFYDDQKKLKTPSSQSTNVYTQKDLKHKETSSSQVLSNIKQQPQQPTNKSTNFNVSKLLDNPVNHSTRSSSIKVTDFQKDLKRKFNNSSSPASSASNNSKLLKSDNKLLLTTAAAVAANSSKALSHFYGTNGQLLSGGNGLLGVQNPHSHLNPHHPHSTSFNYLNQHALAHSASSATGAVTASSAHNPFNLFNSAHSHHPSSFVAPTPTSSSSASSTSSSSTSTASSSTTPSLITQSLNHHQFLLSAAAAAAAANAQSTQNYLNTMANRLFTPYLLDQQHSNTPNNISSSSPAHSNKLATNNSSSNLLVNNNNSHQISKPSFSSSPNLFQHHNHHPYHHHTPKRRRTKVTDTRLSPRNTALRLMGSNGLLTPDQLQQQRGDKSPSYNNDDQENFQDYNDETNTNSNPQQQDDDCESTDSNNPNGGQLATMPNGYNNESASSEYMGYQTSTLSSLHLRKAKLMFFFSRYPSSTILRNYFPDVKFNKANTAQLVKWFSNFR